MPACPLPPFSSSAAVVAAVLSNHNRQRIACQHGFQVDTGRFRIQIAEQVPGAAQAENLVDHVPSAEREERLLRNLVEDFDNRLPVGSILLELQQPASECRCPLGSYSRLSAQLPETLDRVANFLERTDFDDNDIETKIPEPCNRARRRSAAPGQRMRSFHAEDAFEVEAERVSDAREVACCSRVIAPFDHADQQTTDTGLEGELGQVRGQRDDAGRIILLRATAIDDGKADEYRERAT